MAKLVKIEYNGFVEEAIVTNEEDSISSGSYHSPYVAICRACGKTIKHNENSLPISCECDGDYSPSSLMLAMIEHNFPPKIVTSKMTCQDIHIPTKEWEVIKVWW